MGGEHQVEGDGELGRRVRDELDQIAAAEALLGLGLGLGVGVGLGVGQAQLHTDDRVALPS